MRPPSLLATACALALAACTTATMEPGRACGSCHGAHASAFGAAGTLFADRRADADEGLEGATIDLSDARGRRVTMRSNEAGNFYTRQGLTPPLRVTITRGDAVATMAGAPSGDCNACHHPGAGAPGRIHLPASLP